MSEEYVLEKVEGIKKEIESSEFGKLHQVEVWHQVGDGQHLFGELCVRDVRVRVATRWGGTWEGRTSGKLMLYVVHRLHGQASVEEVHADW